MSCLKRCLTPMADGQRVQDVDRPAYVQAFPQPTGAGRARMKMKPLSDVSRLENLHRIGGYRSRRRHLGQRATIGLAELERPVWGSIDLVALLVDGAVMATAEQGEVRECGRAALRPVTEMMPLGEASIAARKPAISVPSVKRSAQRRRNRPRPGADFQ